MHIQNKNQTLGQHQKRTLLYLLLILLLVFVISLFVGRYKISGAEITNTIKTYSYVMMFKVVTIG